MGSPRSRERSWVEIDLSAFRDNLKALKSFLREGQGFIQIVKADAYGHGAAEIARVALEEGAAALGVANLEEGKLLRVQGVKARILILSPALMDELPSILDHGLVPTLSEPAQAEALDRLAARCGIKQTVQIKYDSGMHRSGVAEREFLALWELCHGLPHLEVKGVFSHFAASESDPAFSQRQESEFARLLERHGIEAPFVHLANSSALVNGLGHSARYVRLGILSYGVYTHPAQHDRLELKPVMTFRSALAQIKSVPRGAGVGYNLTWKANRPTLCGIVPVGYADGYDFLLSNRGMVSVRGVLCPVIGRVSMDLLCVDLTDLKPAPRLGDEVTLLGGTQPELRAENLAALYGGSAYELLCQVGRRARRYYYESGKLVTSAPIARREFVSSDYSDSKLSHIIQAAIAQRLDSAEIGELISREILRQFFYNKDREIHYRRNFDHRIRFEESGIRGYWRAFTTLSFDKILATDYFTVACANSEAALKAYFKRRDVEYRWLMDDKFQFGEESFRLSSVRVNGLRLETEVRFQSGCMEIRCFHPNLKELVGKEVRFHIDTATLYPKNSHQLSVFVTELTQGVKIGFAHPEYLAPVECVTVFSGQNKYPRLTRTSGSISVSTRAGEWVFPQSGVVFAY